MNKGYSHFIMVPSVIILITVYQILKVDLCKDPTQFLRFVKDYNTEIHYVTTEDNYHLTMFRIHPHNSLKNNKTALVVHGILDSSDTFAFEEQSVIHELLRKGYEVWAANTRGSKYSCTHKQYSNTSDEYWDFSFQEMGEYDMPAFYKKIFQLTESKKITLVAHSQGATQSFISLSTNKLILEKTEKFIPFAPVLFMNEDAEEANILNAYKKYNISSFFEMMGLNSILLIDVAQNHIAKFVIDLACNKSSFICSYLFGKSIDKNPSSINLERMGEYLSYCPSGTSVKSFEHFTQLIYTGNKPVFKAFDYGLKKNIYKYKAAHPPVYDISKINIPIYLIHGETDVLSNVKNNLNIAKMNSNVIRIMLKNSGHVHFTWGKNKTLFLEIFNKILN